MKYRCETKELAIGYGSAPLASGITLGAVPGQILALIGPNGAGKSTLLKTLAGQLAPLGGAVLLDGRSLTDYTGPARARKLALMLPHTRRTELTSCFEFAAAGRIPYTGRLGILSDADRQAVRDALELVGASPLAGRDFNCISDGQRQRVLLARAICQQPGVLLLDEPTSFLDVKGKIELLTILQKLAHERGLAVIVSLHELDMAQKIADAVVCVFPHSVSGVLTGTNGKTTITNLIKHILTEAGHRVGLIGTIQNEIGDKIVHTDNTTPFVYDLMGLYAQMAEAGCDYVVMEVSSFGLVQERIGVTHFDTAVFTNLTQDHLDYHGTMENYYQATP